MGTFWDERAREDAFFFVDDRLEHGAPDVERFWAGGEESVATMLEQLGGEIAPADTILDLGCGLGRLTRALARRAPEGRVVAVDASQEMLARARELNPQLAGRVDWVHGDGSTLASVADASVDVVFSLVVFQHIPDPAITLGYVAEIGRVLRPGGWGAFHVSTDPRIHDRRPSATRRLKAHVGRAPRGQDDPRWLGSAVDLDALGATATEAGLELERIVGAGTQFTLVRATRAV